MADERLLAPIRRFWTDEEVETNYAAIFAAFISKLEKVTIIISKGTEGDQAGAQVWVQKSDYLEYLDALETRMKEIENEAEGVTAENTTTRHVNFGCKTLQT